MTPGGNLAANFTAIQSRIAQACARSGRNPAEIRLIWVGKTHPRERLLEAHAAGARLFGENRVQEVLEKFPLPPDPATGKPLEYELHLIGHLQRNKVRKVLPLCTAVHSVDSPELWEAVGRIASELDLRRDVFLQVNTSQESAKSGFAPNNLLYALENLPPAPHLRLAGLMTMGPVEGGQEAARICFRALKSLLTDARSRYGSRYPDMKFLSMGMSGDFETAVEEGAHYLRIGTALFNLTPQPPLHP